MVAENESRGGNIFFRGTPRTTQPEKTSKGEGQRRGREVRKFNSSLNLCPLTIYLTRSDKIQFRVQRKKKGGRFSRDSESSYDETKY